MSTAQFSRETGVRGEWRRQPNRFTDRVTADGSSGYPVEPARYHLIVSLACPWAHRSVIVRQLLGITDATSMTIVDPIRDERGWRFTLSAGNRDPVTGAAYLSELYSKSDPEFAGRWTVPTLWDTKTEQIVSNDFHQLTLDLSTEWRALHSADAPDLYPADLREEMDELMKIIYDDVNNGVYKAGFATTQSAYDEAYERLFTRLDWLSSRLAGQRYLMGDRLTEADVRLYTTLARFDAVYHGHFKCNRHKLTELSALWAYVRDLYSIPAFGDSTDFDHDKQHYYVTQDKINPTRIVPRGPALSSWREPSGRERLA